VLFTATSEWADLFLKVGFDAGIGPHALSTQLRLCGFMGSGMDSILRFDESAFAHGKCLWEPSILFHNPAAQAERLDSRTEHPALLHFVTVHKKGNLSQIRRPYSGRLSFILQPEQTCAAKIVT
jgi:hypothetical protein